MARLDLHVHTNRYSQCAECLDPYQIDRFAPKAGIDGVVLTEHDVFWQDEEIENLRRASSHVQIFRGIEVSAVGCHLVVIGIDDAAPLIRGMTIEKICAYAHPQGAVVILAHPYRGGSLRGLGIKLVDAIEVWSTSFTPEQAQRSRRLARRLEKTQVAGSDAHAIAQVGTAWTELPFLPGNERELAAVIRAGVCRPSGPPWPSRSSGRGS